MKKYLALTAILIVTGLVLAAHQGYFRIKTIDCFTQFGPCPADFQRVVAFLFDQPIYRPLPRSLIHSKFQSFPAISSLSLYRRLPHTLVVSIQLRRPLGTLSSEVLGASVVDDQGLVFDTASDSVLPELIVSDPVQVGQLIHPDQLAAMQVLSQVAAISPAKTSGVLTDSVLTIRIPSDIMLLLDIKHLPPGWDASLQAILARSKINGKIPHKIDLRYANPIVTF